ncbi:MAG: UDP-N-acetylmuramoyl-L-alanyl-D-glutamate--2,6-diaminopimelate ligase [Bryobacteraceae bacterium]
MTLQQVLAGVPLLTELPLELLSARVSGLEYDSRRVQPGYLFFAFPGSKVDGREFALSALDKGAVAVVSESEGIRVPHGRKALALAARNFYQKPDERLCVGAITGTNGKTTTSILVDSILRAAGKITSLIGTIEYRLAGKILPAVNTTPESLDVYRILAETERAGGTHVTMEVSSHALALGRVYGISFHTAVFTNLTRDHLDFHGTMENYFAAKRELFAAKPRWAVVNSDDAYGRQITVPEGTRMLRYGFEAGADLRATDLTAGFDGLRFTIQHAAQKIPIASPLIGRINAYNILAACGTALSYGLDWDIIAAGIVECQAVPGRFERVNEGQPFMVIVDYAHTDDALRNVIAVARDLKPRRVITLFGCGGDRDRAKRPLMAMAAAQGSDFVVLTSDNPRSEDPIAIMNDALVGLRRYDVPHLIEPKREKAIQAAINEAREGDIVILAGKGHETYQVFKDQTIHFDDREVAKKALRG